MTKRVREIRIEHLQLPAGVIGRQRIREAVEFELARLARQGVTAPAGDARSAGPLTVDASALTDVRSMGRKVALAARDGIKNR